MPKVDIDYSNTIIYKIYCTDPNIKELYIGHTTNFVQRKHSHKQSCINEKSPNHQCKLYKVIRDNGGWYNWRMEIISFHNCKNNYEARIKEQEYFEKLNATLNSVEPMPKPKDKHCDENKIIYKCETCNVTCQSANLLEVHNQTKKHAKRILMNEVITSQENATIFCELCNFKCCKESEYQRHIFTAKHQKHANGDILSTAITETQPRQSFKCDKCDKKYLDRTGLWKHRKKCLEKPLSDPLTKECLLELIKQNKELLNTVFEQNKIISELIGH